MVSEYGVVGVAVPGDEGDGLRGGGVLADEDRVGPRHHHLVQRPLGELQRVVEQLGRSPRQLSLFVGLADQVAQLLQGGAVVQFLDRFDTDSAQQPVGRPVEDPDDRADHLQVAQSGTGQCLGQPFRYGDGEVLRGQLAQHHLHDRGEDEGEDDGDAGDGAVGDADAGQHGPQQRGDGGSAMKPTTRPVTVMPSWAPESMNDSRSSTLRARAAFLSPSSAWRARASRSAET